MADHRKVLYIVVAGFGLRLLLAATAFALTRGPGPFTTGDASTYLQLAAALTHERQFRGPDGLELYRVPGYPFFLAAGTAIGWPVLFAVVAQAALGGLTTYVVWRTARLLVPPRNALVCAGACAVEPGLVVWSCSVAAETLLATFVALTCLFLAVYMRTRALKWLLFAAVAISAAAYTKPVSYFLPIWLAVLLVWAARMLPLPRRLSHAAAFLALSGALLGLWHLRNGTLTGYYGFSTQVDGVIGLSAPAAIVAEETGARFSQTRAERPRFQRPGSANAETYRETRRLGIQTLRSAALTYAWIHVRGMFRTLFHPGAIQFLALLGYDSAGIDEVVLDHGSVAGLAAAYRHRPVIFWMSAALFLMLLPYLVLPAIAMLRRNVPDLQIRLVLVGVAAYFILASGGPWSQSRFRQPIVPILSVLIGYGLVGSNRRATEEPNRA